jgi:hypothetical protein
MKIRRAGDHTTLTETSERVVAVLARQNVPFRLSPGEIRQNHRRGGMNYLTVIKTNAGLELLISGQGSQKVTVLCTTTDAITILANLNASKLLNDFTIKSRERKPGM